LCCWLPVALAVLLAVLPAALAAVLGGCTTSFSSPPSSAMGWRGVLLL
jgi:hypothetical protein